ncbi:MAG: hypothetical protein IH953_01535 [Chloroflexi bacterium]|nr:hypothetical protein [Chloroflexota bacterium]
MTQTIVEILAVLAAAYPRFELPVATIQIYEQSLADIPVDALHAATLDMVAESKFFPSVAEIRKSAFSLMAEEEPDAYSAWATTLDYVRQGRGHPIKGKSREWDIPAVIEQTVRQIGGWSHLAMAENVAADRARFIDAYDRMIEKQEYKTRQLPQIADLVKRLSITRQEEDPANGQRAISAHTEFPAAAQKKSRSRAIVDAH